VGQSEIVRTTMGCVAAGRTRGGGSRGSVNADIANAVAFLIADDFVTGTVLHAEGAQILV